MFNQISPTTRWGFSAVSLTLLCLLLLLPPTTAAQPVDSQSSDNSVTLKQAVQRTLQRHPRLQVFALKREAADGNEQTAALSPAMELSLEVENFAGSDSLNGTDRAEVTLALSSIIEIGGKRAARQALAAARTGDIEIQRKAESLALIGKVAQTFIATLATQERLLLAGEKVQLGETTHKLVKKRAQAGVAPEAEVLRSAAAITLAEISQSRLQSLHTAQRFELASFWGGDHADFIHLTGDLYQSHAVDSFEMLFERASSNPGIQVYASKQRIAELDLQLIRTESRSDIRWQLGARRFEESGDTGLLAGFSVPLFSGQRNRGAIRSAYAARDQIEFESETALITLKSRLFEAYVQRSTHLQAAHSIRTQLLPSLTQALAATRNAYERGRYSYMDWVAAQTELLDARRQLIDAALTTLQNEMLIEQLTAEPLVKQNPPTVAQPQKQTPNIGLPR